MPKSQRKKTNHFANRSVQGGGIEPGDEYESYVDNEGHITIIKKVAGAAKSLLKYVTAD